MIRGEIARDQATGKFLGVRRPWNTFDLDERLLKRAELKAQNVAQGSERFDRDEIQKLIAWVVRNG